MKYSLVILISTFLSVSLASERCVWVTGVLHCNSDPIKHFGVQVWVMDRDITTDEIMASALTSMDGSFELTGCADDVGFGLSNNPDPYVRIRHFCNTDSDGQVIELPEFTTFVPDNHNLGIINLDAGGRSGGGGGPVEGAYEDDVY